MMLKAKVGVKSQPAHDGTGYSVRAEYPEGGVGPVLIEDLDGASLLTWLRARGGWNPFAENLVGELLGTGRLCEPPREGSSQRPFHIIPMPVNALGQGPETDPTKVVRTEYEVWDATNATVGSFKNEDVAQLIAQILNTTNTFPPARPAV